MMFEQKPTNSQESNGAQPQKSTIQESELQRGAAIARVVDVLALPLTIEPLQEFRGNRSQFKAQPVQCKNRPGR